MFKTILLPIDGATGSERRLLFAGSLACRNRAQLIVVHAHELPEVYSCVDAQRAAGVMVTADVHLGRAADSILDAVRIHQAGLIVMRSRRQKRDSGTEALLGMGSGSSVVLLRAYCPMLVAS